MSEGNGKENGKPTEGEKKEIVAEVPRAVSPDTEKCPDNEAYIDGNVMTIKLYMWGEAAFAKSIGSLELSKDLVKQHFAVMAVRDQMKRPQIIKPTLH